MLALAVPPRVFRRMPSRVLAPFFEIGIGPLWQIFPPCRFERRARRLEISRSAAAIVTRIASRIKPAMPFPRLRSASDARSFGDQSNANASEMDMPAFGPIVDVLTGEGGHAQ
jgi:hypothetical protein